MLQLSSCKYLVYKHICLSHIPRRQLSMCGAHLAGGSLSLLLVQRQDTIWSTATLGQFIWLIVAVLQRGLALLVHVRALLMIQHQAA